MNLHRTRITKFRGLIDSNEYFERGNHKPHCACGERDDTKFWWKLKATMAAEMDKRPMGDTLLGGQFQEWPEATVCWDARCSKCSKTLYNKAATMKSIESCLGLLPASIWMFPADLCAQHIAVSFLLPSVVQPKQFLTYAAMYLLSSVLHDRREIKSAKFDTHLIALG